MSTIDATTLQRGLRYTFEHTPTWSPRVGTYIPGDSYPKGPVPSPGTIDGIIGPLTRISLVAFLGRESGFSVATNRRSVVIENEAAVRQLVYNAGRWSSSSDASQTELQERQRAATAPPITPQPDPTPRQPTVSPTDTGGVLVAVDDVPTGTPVGSSTLGWVLAGLSFVVIGGVVYFTGKRRRR